MSCPGCHCIPTFSLKEQPLTLTEFLVKCHMYRPTCVLRADIQLSLRGKGTWGFLWYYDIFMVFFSVSWYRNIMTIFHNETCFVLFCFSLISFKSNIEVNIQKSFEVPSDKKKKKKRINLCENAVSSVFFLFWKVSLKPIKPIWMSVDLPWSSPFQGKVTCIKNLSLIVFNKLYLKSPLKGLLDWMEHTVNAFLLTIMSEFSIWSLTCLPSPTLSHLILRFTHISRPRGTAYYRSCTWSVWAHPNFIGGVVW